jgi:hypothetical protein
MGCTDCKEPQCLYKGAFYLFTIKDTGVEFFFPNAFIPILHSLLSYAISNAKYVLVRNMLLPSISQDTVTHIFFSLFRCILSMLGCVFEKRHRFI